MTSELRRQSLTFHLAPSSGVPPYLQVVRRVEQALRIGALRPGDRLPTVKEVVAEIAINPNTVSRAYRELEQEGLVEGRQGVGTFVIARPTGPPPETHTRLAKSLRQWVTTARAEGLADQAIESLMHDVLTQLDDEETA